MPPFRAFWLSLGLAIVCVATLAISYYALAEGKRVHSTAYGSVWLFGSPVFVAIAGVAAFYFSMGVTQEKKKTWLAVGGATALAATYFYFLMFVVLNTLGS